MLILSRVQENEILDAVQSVGLDPTDFEWSERPGKNTAYEASKYLRVTHRPTQSYLEFSHASRTGHYLSWSPMFPSSGDRSQIASNWREAQVVVAVWAQLVKHNHDAPDLWRAVRARVVIADASRGDQNDPFTEDELRLLDKGLDEIEQYITATQPLDPDGRGRVRRAFEYLRAAAHRGVTKVDWLNIFLGQLFEMMLERVLQPSVYNAVMTHAATALNSVYHFGLKLLQSAGV